MAYEALDFYDVDSLLTDEERMIRDAVRDWVEENVIPNIEKACRDEVFPDQWRVDLGEMGVLGAPLKGYGCPGLSYMAYGLICQELERGDSGGRQLDSDLWLLASESDQQHDGVVTHAPVPMLERVAQLGECLRRRLVEYVPKRLLRRVAHILVIVVEQLEQVGDGLVASPFGAD